MGVGVGGVWAGSTRMAWVGSLVWLPRAVTFTVISVAGASTHQCPAIIRGAKPAGTGAQVVWEPARYPATGGATGCSWGGGRDHDGWGYRVLLGRRQGS